MAQSSRNQPPKKTILGKCRPLSWSGSPAFKTWAPLANKCRKSIATSSLVISCSLFTLKNGEPIPTAMINRTVCSERNASVRACNVWYTTCIAVSIPYCSLCHGVTPCNGTRQHSRTRWLTGQSTGHSFKPLHLKIFLYIALEEE